jgi:gas vesicle protein
MLGRCIAPLNWNLLMPNAIRQKALLSLIVGCVICVLIADALGQELEPTLEVEAATNEAAAGSQERVSELARQAQDLLSEYRSVVRETESLQIYNENLQRVVNDQKSEVQSINRQLAGLEETNRGIVPLMLEMIGMLDQIVAVDLPFRLDQRRARVERLREMMDQAEVTASEKYRRIMEAYQSELEFGRTTEAYSDQLPGSGQTVNFLRVGRTLLVYQTSDQSETGWFNSRTRQYEVLPDHYRLEVREGLAIARNEKAPDLVVLPVPGPEKLQ